MSHSFSPSDLFVPFEYVTFVVFVFPIIKKKTLPRAFLGFRCLEQRVSQSKNLEYSES